MSGYLLNTYTMHKVRDNYLAEIIITVVVLTMLLTSCASSKYYTGCDGKKKIKMINKW